MNALTYSTARANLAGLMEKICEDHSPVIITKKGDTSVVMMSLEDYDSMEETAYLLRSPKNAERIKTAIKDIKKRNVVRKTLEELKNACR